MLKRFLFALLLVLLAPISAWAQCSGGLLINCPAATSLQPTDVLFGYQLSQSPHTRKVAVSQITGGGFAASFSTLNATGGGTLGGTWNLTGGGTALAVSSSASVGGSLGVTGAGNFSGGGTLGGAWTMSGAITLNTAGTGLVVTNNALIGGTLGVTGLSTLSLTRTRLQNFTSGSVPTALGPGDTIFEPDCQNGTEGVGSGTGCLAVANNSGVYTKLPYPSPLVITFGTTGLTGRLGGTVATQGNGTSLLSASGTFVPGNAITTNASGVAVDSGTPPSGGGGGAGTVANCVTAGSLAVYAAAGATVTCLTQAISSVVSRSSGGVLTEATSLPSGLTAPNLNLTGTATAIAATFTGTLTEAASVAGGANHICPAGTAPTSPTNGQEWCTTLGMFGRFNGVTVGPLIGTAQLSVSGVALAYNSGTGQFTCPGCVTTWTAPLTFGAATASITNFPWQAVWQADATTAVHNDSYFVPPRWRYTTGTVTDIFFWTAGTSTPTFNVTLQANGSNVTGCTNVAVTATNTPTSPGTATCSAANTLAHNQSLALIISSTSGTPVSAGVGINATFTP